MLRHRHHRYASLGAFRLHWCAYAYIVPGLIVSGIGQGIVWTAVWIAAASGVAHHEQGIASGTALNVGNAIGIAVLVAFANRSIGGLQGDALRDGLSVGAQHAFYLATAGLLLGLLVSLTFSRKASAKVQAETT